MLDVVSRDTMVETGIDIFCSRLCGRSDRKFDGKFLRRYQGYVPRRLCGAPDPFDPWNGLGEGNTRGYRYGRNHSTGGTQESGGFSLGGFVRDTLTGAVIGGLGSAGFYGAGRAVEVLRGSVGRSKGGSATLNHNATSGVKLTSTPGKTTTVLGRYSSGTRDIIEELNLPKSMDFSGKPGGFNLLNTPDNLYTKLGPDGFWEKYNKPFLDAAISRGDEMLMSTPINNSTLYTEFGELTGYGREYYYLLSKGYVYVDGKMIFKGVK